MLWGNLIKVKCELSLLVPVVLVVGSCCIMITKCTLFHNKLPLLVQNITWYRYLGILESDKDFLD
jgi:hypothetical protein